MKPLIVSALIATAGFVGSAQALTGPTLSGDAGHVLPGGDFSTLSPAQINAVKALAHSGHRSPHQRARTGVQER